MEMYYSNRLFKNAKMIVKYVLPSFLDKQEFINFALMCKFAYECAQEYKLLWKKQLVILSKEYGFLVDENATQGFGYVDIDLNRTIENQILYKLKNHEHSYRMFTKDGIAALGALRRGWSWTDHVLNYDRIDLEDTMFTNPVFYLKSVSWYNPI